MEFDKRDEKMTQDIESLKSLIEGAENGSIEIIDGVTYPTSYIWREIAKIALDLANQQEWFESYEDQAKFIEKEQ